MSTKNDSNLSTTIKGRKYTYIGENTTMEKITAFAEEIGYQVLVMMIEGKEYFYIHTGEPMYYFENGQPAFAPQDLLVQGACDSSKDREAAEFWLGVKEQNQLDDAEEAFWASDEGKLLTRRREATKRYQDEEGLSYDEAEAKAYREIQ